MTTAVDVLNIIGLGMGLAGLCITTWDLWPEYQLHKARSTMARARAMLEVTNTMQQAALRDRGELSPSDFGRDVSIANAQFVSRMVRERGLDDGMLNHLDALLDQAHRRLGSRKYGASFVFYPDRFGEPVGSEDYIRMLKGLMPEVRRFFEIEDVLEDREANNTTRRRPPLSLGIFLLAMSYLLPAVGYLL